MIVDVTDKLQEGMAQINNRDHYLLLENQLENPTRSLTQTLTRSSTRTRTRVQTRGNISPALKQENRANINPTLTRSLT